MNLRDQAERDLALTLEDTKGFGIDVDVTDPAGTTATLKGQTGDANLLQAIDINSDINNRTPHISLRISSVIAAGLELPRIEPDTDSNPFIVEFSDPNGIIRKYTVAEPKFDHTLGVVTVLLELLKD